MLGNTNALINMGGDVYIDLFPQINISRTLLSTTSSDTTCAPEQHFYFCENRPLDGETIIEFYDTYTTFNNTLKIKDKDFLRLGKHSWPLINNTYHTIIPSNTGGTVSIINNPNYSFNIGVKSIQSNLTGTLWYILTDSSPGFQNHCEVYGITFNKNTLISSFYVGRVGSPNFSGRSSIYITPIVINLNN